MFLLIIFLFSCLAAPTEEPCEHVQNMASDCEIEDFVISAEVQDFILEKTNELSERGVEEYKRWEEFCAAFAKRRRAVQEAAAPGISQGGNDVLSITPKALPHKARVKKPSQFIQSPFNESIKVSTEQEEVYQKIMLSNKHIRPSRSQIKK
jgi:hypothetical protein